MRAMPVLSLASGFLLTATAANADARAADGVVATGNDASAGAAMTSAGLSGEGSPGATPDALKSPSAARDIRTELPIVAYTYTATGAPAGTVGAYAYGLGLAGTGQRFTAGGGATVWGSPVDRLTLIADALRDVYLLDRFAPSFAATVRLLGNASEGPSLGAMAKYKVEGFGSDPNGDLESEVEGGLLLSYARRAFHFDVNTVTGFGLTDDGEVDTEGRLRIGYDIAPHARLGLDGQARWRLAGRDRLPGNRSWDFAGGPQVLVSAGRYFGSLTTGPATMGLTSLDAGAMGWTAMASVGGAL